MDDYSCQMATLTPNITSGGYDTEVTVKSNGLGIGHLEKENARQFDFERRSCNFKSKSCFCFNRK